MSRQTTQTFIVILISYILLGFTMHDPEEENRQAIRILLKGVADAWETGDTAAFRKYYSDKGETRMIEGGSQNIGLDDFIQRHVLPHHKEYAGLDISVKDVEIHIVNISSIAWAIQDFEVNGRTKDGKEFSATGYETFILRRFNDKWKIVHSHSSTRRLKSETK